jgi:hypothetical protein
MDLKPYNEQEFNRMCAEFLGWNLEDGYYNRDMHHDYSFVKPDEMYFHSHWNWIMEVVERIEMTNSSSWMGSYVTIWSNREGCTIEVKTTSTDFYTSIPVKTTKKEAVVEAIWQFLNWHNEQKQ